MKRGFLAMAAGVALVIGAVPAFGQTASVTVLGGSLSVSTSNFSFSNATLTGANQTVTTNAASAWSAIDPRGTGAAWTLSVTGANLSSAAGTVETTARTISVSNVGMWTGSPSAGAGSDATSNITASYTSSGSALTLTTGAQTVMSASGTSKGTYTFTPGLSLTIPANAYRSNYAVGTSGAQNAYSATLTVTLA